MFIRNNPEDQNRIEILISCNFINSVAKNHHLYQLYEIFI